MKKFNSYTLLFCRLHTAIKSIIIYTMARWCITLFKYILLQQCDKQIYVPITTYYF